MVGRKEYGKKSTARFGCSKARLCSGEGAERKAIITIKASKNSPITLKAINIGRLADPPRKATNDNTIAMIPVKISKFQPENVIILGTC